MQTTSINTKFLKVSEIIIYFLEITFHIEKLIPSYILRDFPFIRAQVQSILSPRFAGVFFF